MATFNYTLTGQIEAPDGTTLTPTGTGLILPNGHILEMWEQWELDESEDGNLTYDDMTRMGCHYDGDMTRFEEA